MRTCYALAFFSIENGRPVFVGVGLYSDSADTITKSPKLLACELAHGEGDSYDQARADVLNLLRQLRDREWAVPLIVAHPSFSPGAWRAEPPKPIPMVLTCPSCSVRHIDEGNYALMPHHTHACQSCGMCWRPAVVPTVGVRFLPGFKDGAP